MIHGWNCIGLINIGQCNFFSQAIKLLAKSKRMSLHWDLMLYVNRMFECYEIDNSVLEDEDTVRVVTCFVLDMLTF